MTDLLTDADVVETPALSEQMADFVAGLRDLADLLESHPEGANQIYSPGVSLAIYSADTPEEIAATRRLFGGRWEKAWDDTFFRMTRLIRPSISIRISSYRKNVCERVVVGQETVRVPDPEAVKLVPTVEKVQDIVEWRCPEILADGDVDGSAVEVAGELDMPDVTAEAIIDGTQRLIADVSAGLDPEDIPF